MAKTEAAERRMLSEAVLVSVVERSSVLTHFHGGGRVLIPRSRRYQTHRALRRRCFWHAQKTTAAVTHETRSCCEPSDHGSPRSDSGLHIPRPHSMMQHAFRDIRELVYQRGCDGSTECTQQFAVLSSGVLWPGALAHGTILPHAARYECDKDRSGSCSNR